MDITNNNPDYTVPHLSAPLAEYLLEQFSSDNQIADGLLSDPNVVRSEAYLLGFLGGLGFAQSVIRTIITNQEGHNEELVDVTENYLDN